VFSLPVETWLNVKGKPQLPPEEKVRKVSGSLDEGAGQLLNPGEGVTEIERSRGQSNTMA
jgi:hypothetical protein